MEDDYIYELVMKDEIAIFEKLKLFAVLGYFVYRIIKHVKSPPRLYLKVMKKQNDIRLKTNFTY